MQNQGFVDEGCQQFAMHLSIKFFLAEDEQKSLCTTSLVCFGCFLRFSLKLPRDIVCIIFEEAWEPQFWSVVSVPILCDPSTRSSDVYRLCCSINPKPSMCLFAKGIAKWIDNDDNLLFDDLSDGDELYYHEKFLVVKCNISDSAMVTTVRLLAEHTWNQASKFLGEKIGVADPSTYALHYEGLKLKGDVLVMDSNLSRGSMLWFKKIVPDVWDPT